MPIYQQYDNEYAEGFFQYKTWWTKNENRTIVLMADVLLNKIFFYSQFNQYPSHFKTAKHDFNDTVVIMGTDPEYQLGGSYYIRIRPDFGIYDLVAGREYVFYFTAFSQAPGSMDELSYGQDTLILGEEKIGFVN